MKVKTFSHGIILFILMLLSSHNSFAACARGGGLFADKSISTSTVALPANIVVESRNYDLGEVIYDSGWINGSNSSLTMSGCGKGYVLGYFYVPSPQVNSPEGTTIVATNITGLGVRVTAKQQSSQYDNPYEIDNSWKPGDGKTSDHTLKNSQYKIELVSLGGQISSGQLSFGSPIAQIDFRESASHSANGDVATNLALSNANVVMKAMGCTADVSTISFPFGYVTLPEFDGKTKAGSAPTQDVNLSCEPGSNVSASITATEASGDNANHTVIALTGAGTDGVATGVGVQLGLKASGYDSGNNGLPLNQSVPLITSSRNNQVLVSGGASAQEKLTLSATYYKTAATITPGSANASATLTLTYN
jgi:type 1 fimbria pilin